MLPISGAQRGDTRPLPETSAQRETAAARAGNGNAAAVRFRGVAIGFPLPDGGTYAAVAATDLAVGAHEFVAIVGPTGCGKSTLLNVAAGLLAPIAGEIIVLGQRLAGLNRHAGYLFQQDAVMPWKTARDNVAIALEVAGIPRPRRWSARRPGSSASASPPSATAIPTSSRAGRGSASASPRC